MNVGVRMYNTGFGDCFLLTFPAPDRPRKVLIDCGKHRLSTTGPKMSRIVQQVLADIAGPAGPSVDVVVGTHRHLDHVDGFAAPGWDAVRVSEVWMPWTEHPTDPVAREICDRQSRRAERMRNRIAALGLDAAEADYMLGYAGNNLTNAAAMKLLHNGFQGNPIRRFLPDDQLDHCRLTQTVLPGVEVYVLGPPKDPEVLREMDPPEAESFFRALEMSATKIDQRPSAFDERWLLNRTAYEQKIGYPLDEFFPPASEAKLGDIADDPAFELAARLEQAVNSTSLILLFHIGDAWLLFPGDAQWGSWNAILNNPSHCAMLEKLTFYKVGHHGSHNATPISFVNGYITDKCRAMMPFGKVARWPTIPRQGLLDTLAKKSVALARSDVAPAGSLHFTSQMENGEVLYIDTEVPI